MDNKKLSDLFKASTQEATDVALSEILPEVVKEYGGCIVGESLGVLLGEIVGAVLPRVNSVWLTYKQNRLESNVCYLFSVLMKYQKTLEERLTILEKKESTREFLRFSTELLLDNIVDEIQQSKVNYSVNGYVNLLQTEEPNQDIALMFFKTLAQLNELDIRVLKLYDSRTATESGYDVIEQEGIDYEQFRFVKEKLERFGLLQSRNAEWADENLDDIVKYLQAVEKDNKSSRPKGVKLPKLRKISRSDSYKITLLGRRYLQLIVDV